MAIDLRIRVFRNADNKPFYKLYTSQASADKYFTDFTADAMVQQRYSSLTHSLSPLLSLSSSLSLTDSHTHSLSHSPLLISSALNYHSWKGVPNIDGRIADFSYDPSLTTIVQDKGYAPRQQEGGWRFIRFRDDKTVPSNEVTVQNLWKCINDSVGAPEIIAKMDLIRLNWKNREKGIPQQMYLPLSLSLILHYFILL